MTKNTLLGKTFKAEIVEVEASTAVAFRQNQSKVLNLREHIWSIFRVFKCCMLVFAFTEKKKKKACYMMDRCLALDILTQTGKSFFIKNYVRPL